MLWQVTTWRGSGREQAEQEDEQILVSCLAQAEMNLLGKNISLRLSLLKVQGKASKLSNQKAPWAKLILLSNFYSTVPSA